MVYCRNCGKELLPQAAICIGCGVAPPKGGSYCQNCGSPVVPLAEVCVKCGVRLAHAHHKSRTASILLAVFLSYWTWLYTYKRDRRKFWLSLSLTLLFTVPSVPLFFWMNATPAIEVSDAATIIAGTWVIVGWLAGVGIWVWAIVNAAAKPEYWYDHY